MRKLCNVLCVGLLGLWLGVAQAGIWQPLEPAAFDQARAEHKLVLLDLSAEWCAFCNQMDATTWKDPKVQEVMSRHYVALRVVDEAQPELAEKYREYGRPAVIIMNAAGEQLMTRRGYMKPKWMQWMLEALAQEHLQP